MGGLRGPQSGEVLPRDADDALPILPNRETARNVTRQRASNAMTPRFDSMERGPVSSDARSKVDRRRVFKTLVRIAVVIALGFALNRCWSDISMPAKNSPISRHSETEAWRNPPEGTVNMLLPNGTPVSFEKGSMNHELQRFLASKQAPPAVFDFDQFYFTYGSAEPMIVPEDGMRDLAAILVAYPRARVKIVGYSGGEKPVSGVDLGGQRADAIVDALTGMGVPGTRMEPESGGDPSIVDETSSPDDRFDDGNGQLIVLDK